MSKLGKGSYKGKHWMQLPENRERVVAMAKKRAALKRTKFRKIAKEATKIVRRGPYKTSKKVNKATSLVVNGWRITLGKDEVRIDHE